MQIVDDRRVFLTRKRTHDLADLPGGQQLGDADPPDARVVADDRKVLGALLRQRVEQVDRTARHPEAADVDDGAIVNVGDGLPEAVDDLVHHDEEQS